MLGRPSKCTPEVTEAVCQSLAAGVDVETAARREGVGRRTLYEWRERAQAGEEPYLTFFDACEIALASCELEVTRGILAASKKNWKAGAWWLKWRELKGVTKVDLGINGKGKPSAPKGLSAATVQLIRERILYGDRGPPVETEGESVPAPLALPDVAGGER